MSGCHNPYIPIHPAKSEVEILDEKIKKLEKEDQNGYMFLKGQIDMLSHYVNAHEAYLKKIDKVNLLDPEKTFHNMKVMKERIDKLEKKIEAKIEAIGNISDLVNRSIRNFQDQDGLRPHKCPICNGDGRLPPMLIKKNEIEQYYRAPCHMCESKGILWG